MDEFLQQLNESQRNAVLYNEGPSLVIAGAGSGKTRVLTYKVAYLLANGISAYNILALTFTNKAAREMKNRVAQIVGEETAKRLWMGTFHSIFSRILRREAEHIGFRHDFTVYDAQDSKNLIKAIIKEKVLDDKLYKTSAVQSRISMAKNALITPAQYSADRELIASDQHSRRGRLYEIYIEYWNRCKTAQVMDFDDLLLYTYLLFDKNPEILERYRNLFRFILVDEYQDTNSVQHEIIRMLAADHHRVCVVGDDAQSIYSFRGANIDNILNFRKVYPESKLFKLEQNYRSTQTIVNAANSLIYKNKEQISKKVFSEKNVGDRLQVLSSFSDFEEGYNVASRIAEMRMLAQYAYSDFAILYRTNAQSRILEEALRRINIPYKIYGGLSFYQRKEVKDVIAYMRLIINPNDEEALKRIINYPTRGIGDTTVKKIISASSLHHTGLWEVISNPLNYNLKIQNNTIQKIGDFRAFIERFREKLTTQNAYEIGVALIKEAGLVNELYEDRTPEGLSRVQNIEELSNSLYEFVSSRLEEGNPGIMIGDFLAEIALLTDQDIEKGKEDTNRVTMMTIHSAKGLEFRNVFVVGLEEDLFPSEQCKHSPRELEEERRLFYVAITRAEENAILTYAKSRFHNGQSRICTPSRFIRDIDREYLKLPADASSFVSTSYSKPDPMPFYTNTRKLTLPENETSHQQIGELHVGDRIQHERFGCGSIVELLGENENARASVEFESFGKKQLLLKFARFEVIK
ncbi:DNA helicase [Bacteroidia bacterium]|nr:DNA helicase [Bacteroidia bacterium]